MRGCILLVSAIERRTPECCFVGTITSDRALNSFFFIYIHESEGNRSLDNGTIIGEGNMSDSNQKLWTLISCTIAHLHLTAFRAEVNTSGPGAPVVPPLAVEICWRPPRIQLGGNNLRQQTSLITERRASLAAVRGREQHITVIVLAVILPASRGSPNLSERLLSSKVASGLLSPQSWELMGKGNLNFSLKFNCLTWSCSLSAFHTTDSFLSSFILFFFRGLDPPGCLVVPRHPRRAILSSALSLGGTFPPREISLPPPWALHLSDEQVKHGRSLSARR